MSITPTTGVTMYIQTRGKELFVSTADDMKYYLSPAARFIGTTKFTLRRWARQRRIPHFRFGRRIVFAQADLEAFMKAHRVSVAKKFAWDCDG